MKVSDLMSNLRREWPTLSCPSNDGVHFWTHEWEKHGTCAESELDQHDYFEAGLKLKQKANLLHALTNAGTIFISYALQIYIYIYIYIYYILFS